MNFDECLLNFAGCGVHCLELNNIYHGLFSARGKTKHVLIPKWTYTAVFIVRSLSIKNGKAPLQHILWHMLVIDPIYWSFATNVCIFRNPKKLLALQTWFIASTFKWGTLKLGHVLNYYFFCPRDGRELISSTNFRTRVFQLSGIMWYLPSKP